MKSFEILLRVLSCDIAVRCGDEASSDLLRECYSEFLLPAETEFLPALGYDVSLAGHANGWTMRRDKTAIHCHDSYDLIYKFEKDMTERVQLLRADLFFIHGAALSVDERCVIVSGESGIGKSSLAWFMSHNGFDYLSDELAPIDPNILQVEPYPHALCLKNKPLSEPALTASTYYTEVTLHVPAYELPTRALDRPCALSFLVFIEGALNGQDLLVFPGGAHEAVKRADDMYQLQWKERYGFVKLALKHGYTIMPFGMVGPDEFYSHLIEGDEIPESALGGILKRLGMLDKNTRPDMLPPIPIGALGSLFPKPKRCYLGFGQPVHLAAQKKKPTKAQLNKIRNQVASEIEEQLAQLLLMQEQGRNDESLLRRILSI